MTTKELVKKVDMLDAMLTQAMKEVRRLTDEVERIKLSRNQGYNYHGLQKEIWRD